MVIWEVPVPVTLLPATSMVSKIVLSVVFLIVILPVWTVTFSLKFKTMFASLATLGASSAGVDELRVGNTFAKLVKVKAVVEPIPAYDPLIASANAVPSINT